VDGELAHSTPHYGRFHLSVLGWPIDGTGDDAKMGTSRSFSEGVFQNVEHVHGITDFPKPSGPSIVNG
jgi:hypothetical protein